MAQPPDDVVRYIPLLETLKTAGSELEVQTWWSPFGVDLLEREPTDSRKLAAVVLVARSLRRTTRELESRVPSSTVGNLPELVPEPADDWQSRVTSVLLARLDSEASRCPYCPPGFEGCAFCGGTGFVERVRLREVHDLVETLRYAYVPSLPFSIEERVTRLIDPAVDPPECLRIDLEPRRGGSAYRDTFELEPEFFGHSFGDALVQARTAARAFGSEPDLVRKDVRAYAWPLLLVRWSGFGLDRTVALVVRPGDLAHVAVVQRD
ncbi:MAG: hypothetical protein HYY06_26870 [Deltaproteobacteria bacterium]|nr:hypothetical protein [Deltaproteobacteria bacterium]